jgi:hypothetical protein
VSRLTGFVATVRRAVQGAVSITTRGEKVELALDRPKSFSDDTSQAMARHWIEAVYKNIPQVFEVLIDFTENTKDLFIILPHNRDPFLARVAVPRCCL